MAFDWEDEKKPQSTRVLNFLWDLRWHAHHEIDRAISPGKGTRYGGRIGELRDAGWMILSRPVDGNKATGNKATGNKATGNKATGNKYRLLSRQHGPPWVPRVPVYLREEDVDTMLKAGGVAVTAEGELRDSLEKFRRGASAKKADKARDARKSWFKSHKPATFSCEELAYIRGCRDPVPGDWGARSPEDDDPLEVDILAMLHGASITGV